MLDDIIHTFAIMKKKPFAQKTDLITLGGFVLVVLGVLSLILSLVGARFSFLAFLDHWGRLPGFLLRLLMVMIGFVIVFVNRSEELHDSSEIDS